MKFFCIADHDSSLGFRLTGLDTREVTTREEAQAALREALAKPELGIVVITSVAAAHLRAEINQVIYERELPLILEVPSKGGKVEGGGVGDFLKMAVGIDI